MVSKLWGTSHNSEKNLNPKPCKKKVKNILNHNFKIGHTFRRYFSNNHSLRVWAKFNSAFYKKITKAQQQEKDEWFLDLLSRLKIHRALLFIEKKERKCSLAKINHFYWISHKWKSIKGADSLKNWKKFKICFFCLKWFIIMLSNRENKQICKQFTPGAIPGNIFFLGQCLGDITILGRYHNIQKMALPQCYGNIAICHILWAYLPNVYPISYNDMLKKWNSITHSKNISVFCSDL